MRLLLFECEKIFFSKKFLYLMVLLVIGIALLFTRNVMFQSYIEKEEREHIEKQIKTSQRNLNNHQTVLEQDPKDEKQLQLQEMNSRMLDQLYQLSGIASSDNWQAKLTLQNEIYANSLAYKEAGGEIPISDRDIREQMAINDKLLKEDIPPEHDIYSTALPNFMKQVVDLFLNLGAFIILLIMIGETMTGEYENYSINMLFTQPLKKQKIIMGKFWSAVLLYAIMMTVVLLATTLIGLVFGKEGSFQYPVLIEKNGGIEFLAVSDYMLKGLLIVSATILLIIPLYLLYSLLFKQTLLTLAILIMTIAAGYALSVFVAWGTLAYFNPFLNFQPGNMIIFQNDHKWFQAIPVSLILSAVFYIMALMRINTTKIA